MNLKQLNIYFIRIVVVDKKMIVILENERWIIMIGIFPNQNMLFTLSMNIFKILLKKTCFKMVGQI